MKPNSAVQEIVMLETVPLIMEAHQSTANVDHCLPATKRVLGHNLVIAARPADTAGARTITAVPLTVTQGHV